MSDFNTDLNPSYGGPYVGGTHRANPKELMFRICNANPGISQKEAISTFKDEILVDEHLIDAMGLIDACLEYVGVLTYSAWLKLRPKPARPAASPAAASQPAAEARRATATTAEAIVRNIVEHRLLNGNLLLDSTFREVGKDNKRYAKLAKAGKPNQIVGKTLSMDQIVRLVK
jgi:hypothetical protein